jgi:hypothetical protein
MSVTTIRLLCRFHPFAPLTTSDSGFGKSYRFFWLECTACLSYHFFARTVPSQNSINLHPVRCRVQTRNAVVRPAPCLVHFKLVTAVIDVQVM